MFRILDAITYNYDASTVIAFEAKEVHIPIASTIAEFFL